MNDYDNNCDALHLAEAIRAACLTAALESYEDASMRGLCHEGAWECAIGAMRSLNLLHIIVQYRTTSPRRNTTPAHRSAGPAEQREERYRERNARHFPTPPQTCSSSVS